MGVDLKQEKGLHSCRLPEKLVCNDAGCILCTSQRIYTNMLFAWKLDQSLSKMPYSTVLPMILQLTPGRTCIKVIF